MALPSQQESGYKWVVLAVGMFAQASTSTFFQGLASVGPVLRHEEGLSLAGLGIVLGAPPAGFVLTLLAWGWASDRFNERHVMVVGLIGAAAGLFACGQVSGLWPVTLCLGFAGAAGASVNAASGRAVLLWFVAERRGLAMGLRQTAVPLGACVAAILLPGLVSHLGMGAGFRGLAAFCLLGALASFLWIREPPHRPVAFVSAVLLEGAEETQPRFLYNRQLWKLVGASSSLVVCQFTFVAFLVEMLHGRRGMSLALAGLVFASAQICGGAARVIVGAWSDRSVGRIRPLRSIAFGMAGGGLLIGAATDGPLWLLVPVAVGVGSLFICWNGLAFTAAGEMADVSQVGAALGLQNTASFLSASVTSSLAGLLISLVGFPAVYALTAVPALLAGFLLTRVGSSRPVSSLASRCEAM